MSPLRRAGAVIVCALAVYAPPLRARGGIVRLHSPWAEPSPTGAFRAAASGEGFDGRWTLGARLTLEPPVAVHLLDLDVRPPRPGGR